MKKSSLFFLSFCVIGMVIQGCSKSKTYAELQKDERKAIQNYISRENINVISERDFYAQDSTTNVAENQYVLFGDNGVYMQIVNKGSGQKLQEGERVEILSRYVEVNILSGDTISGNIYSPIPDKFYCKKTGTSLSGQFDVNQSIMSLYSASVPQGWLIPLNFVNLGRRTSDLATVKLIVPHKMGQSDARQVVYPCYYEITYQRNL